MKLLVDQHNRVWVQDRTPEGRYIAEAMIKSDWQQGLELRVDTVPDDTRLRIRREDGYQLYELRPEREQPEGWADRIQGLLMSHAWELAMHKRRGLMGAPEGVGDAAMLSGHASLLGRASAKMRREAAGRGKPGESAELDQLEAMADALGAIDAALDAVSARIADGTYTTRDEITAAPEWPQ